MTSAYSVFPEPGRPHAALLVLKVTDREGNVLEENRPEPHDAIRADTAFVMTNLLRGVVQRGTAREGRGARLAARRQDRHDRRLHRRLVHRLRSRHHARRVGRLRPEEADRRRHDRRRGGAADLDRHHEGLDRRPQGAAAVRAARATSSSCRSTRAPVRASRRRAPGRFTRRSSPAPSRARFRQ